ncbi:copper resistance protein NlpE N-terminal domain-containing protein [Fibrella sp. HMF5335]|uniref:Copper resistance protein NlpE N-terminal domain-containing protein n=1 Tax=Fibrella rubiginis TaxID=2817060 RepID=A0A939GJW5_9BACT|nr:copper resistance protein NlpE [Fibrella rubiginis]MBO0938121.1 copper resistance protein NlpE N-terminal domain-containing protein [Fibrella rubiginis]
MKVYSLLLLILTLLTGCDSKPKETATSTVDTSFNNLDSARTAPKITSRKKLDYQGVYRGTLPCAGCTGIRLEVDLRSDSTYQLTTTYLGKGDEKPIIKRGTFSWNKADSLITLQGVTDQPNKYLVGNNTISQLDMDGTRVLGPSARRYILRK